MDKKILGNFVSFFPPIAYSIYTVVINARNSGIDWYAVMYAGIIGVISYAIGQKIKSKGEVE